MTIMEIEEEYLERRADEYVLMANPADPDSFISSISFDGEIKQGPLEMAVIIELELALSLQRWSWPVPVVIERSKAQEYLDRLKKHHHPAFEEQPQAAE